MCTVVVMVRPGHAWPLLFAANRDERLDREWDPPAAYWPTRPGVVGGRDRLGAGTWMATRAGVIAAVLNRPGSLGPQTGKRSRGELPLLALEHGSAESSSRALERLDAGAYRTFNLVVAGPDGAWFLRGEGQGRPEAMALTAGVHMVTAHDPDDCASPRTARHLPLFQIARPPEPDRGEWESWAGLLANRHGTRASAINVPPENGFGTVCASLAAVSAVGATRWLFAAGPPDRAVFAPVSLP